MRDFCAGNKSSGKYAEKNRRDEEWNPYEGEEEPVDGCCVRECGAGVTGNRGGNSMEMPELSEQERDNIKVWNGRMSGPKPLPEWGNQPPRRPIPGPKPLQPEWGNQPPRRPKPGRKESIPVPEWENQPSERLIPGSEWENQSARRSVPSEWENLEEQQGQTAEFRDGLPYIRYNYEDIIEEEKQTEKDLRMLQSMYPEAVKEILPLVEEICDRMEYEGSMMFDEHPDKTTVRRLSDEICEQTGDVWPREPVQEPDGVMSMQYQGGGKGPLGELIQILLLQEMHHRRCRHRRCRPHMF